MTSCPHCGREVPAGAKHCPHDGTPLPPPESIPTAAHTPAKVGREVVRVADAPATSGAEPTFASTGTSPGVPSAIGDMTGETLDDRYLLERRIGSGGLGQVYRARHLRMHRQFAVKVMHAELALQPTFIKRFDREARALSRLSHPCCVSVTDYGKTTTGAPYIVMELCAGEPLSDTIDRGGLPLGEALRTMRELLGGLDHAHREGIVHRDLKPANIMLVPEPIEQKRHVPKILDFGLAKLRSGEEGGTQLTAAGLVMGTPPYIAPELISGGGSAAESCSDIYSMGVILYELVCGRRPFDADDLLRLLDKHLREPPPPPEQIRPGLPPDLIAVMLRALAKRPEDRISSAEEFRRALDDLRPLPPALQAAPPPAEPGATSEAPAAAPAASAGAGLDRRAPRPASPTPRASTTRSLRSALERKHWLWIAGGAAIALTVVLLIALLGGDGDVRSDDRSATRAGAGGSAREAEAKSPSASAAREPDRSSAAADAHDPARPSSADRSPEPSGGKTADEASAWRPTAELARLLHAWKSGRSWTRRRVAARMRRYLRHHPEDGQGHLVVGRLMLEALWASDGLALIERALRHHPGLQVDAQTNVSIALAIRGRAARRARRLLAQTAGRRTVAALAVARLVVHDRSAQRRLNRALQHARADGDAISSRDSKLARIATSNDCSARRATFAQIDQGARDDPYVEAVGELSARRGCKLSFDAKASGGR